MHNYIDACSLICRGYNNIFHFLCECVLLRTEPYRPWEDLPGAVHHTNLQTLRMKQHNRAYSSREHVTPIAVLLRRHAATASGKWFVLSRLLRLPTHIRWCFAAVSYLCCVIVSCLCNLLTRPRRFKATSQDEKQEINLLWLTMIW